VLKSISSQAEAVLKPGSHSSSLEPSDDENVSAVDKLAVKLLQERQAYVDRVEAEKVEAAAQVQRKKICLTSLFLLLLVSELGTS